MKKNILIGLVIVVSVVLVAGVVLISRNSQRSELLQERLTQAAEVQSPQEIEAVLRVDANATSSLDIVTATTTMGTTSSKTQTKVPSMPVLAKRTALLADGCFWCVQHDLQKVNGVVSVQSGYAGGTNDNPTYENYAEFGHREVVLVTYNPSKVTFANLVEHIIKHGDPTDPNGSFHDRGSQYAPAIYFETEDEKNTARKVIDAIDALHVFKQPLPLVVIPMVKFWPAEEYHQDYGNKNPIRYGYYRSGSGRDAFIAAHWGEHADEFTVSNKLVDTQITIATTPTNSQMPWLTYVKPSESELRKLLTPLQYTVTQEQGTESPHDNLYDNNFAEGIYVDVLSGEPLYSSKDKFDSGTGWPSFVKPIAIGAVVTKEDNTLFQTRTEVRSRYADNHIGHVFPDGPTERGGLRYCMNSASMRFVAKADMEKEGYGYLLTQL